MAPLPVGTAVPAPLPASSSSPWSSTERSAATLRHSLRNCSLPLPTPFRKTALPTITNQLTADITASRPMTAQPSGVREPMITPIYPFLRLLSQLVGCSSSPSLTSLAAPSAP